MINENSDQDDLDFILDDENATVVEPTNQPEEDDAKPDQEVEEFLDGGEVYLDPTIATLLNSKGISDPNSIKFEEDGEIVEKSWLDLTDEERLNILGTSEPEVDSDLDDSEIDLINHLRTNNLSVAEFVEAIRQQTFEELQGESTYETYTIDEISDDELFILDLKSKIPDLSDTEAQVELERAKGNTDLFTKLINGVRTKYKEVETQQLEAQALVAQEQANQEYEKAQELVSTSLDSFNSIGGLGITLEEDDKEEIAQFILGVDNTGTRYLEKALSDPETLVKLAWFALKGEEALDSVSEYYKQQIKEVGRTNYNKGLEDGKSGKSEKSTKSKKPRLVVGSPQSSKAKRQESVDDLTIEDLF